MLLQEKLKPYRIILASRSPRRRQLLKDAEIDYRLAEDFDAEEVYPADLPVEAVPEYLSNLKSRLYPGSLAPDEILITADTVVCLEGRIIGKPVDQADAVSILGRLSGNRHTVVTGVTLRSASLQKSFSVCSDVFFRKLTDEEIDYYIASYKPFDKAGAYGIQEWIGCIGIERIEGSFYNVMGLPIQRLYLELDDFIREMQEKDTDSR